MRALAILLLSSTLLAAAAGKVVRAAGEADERVGPVRTNQQGIHFKAPATKKEWEARKAEVRQRVLTACGLQPMPQKTALNPQVYGRLERDGYTVEKVVLETMPGFYLTGNLYRPAGKQGPFPGILNPHGHWETGRFNEAIQARCVGQARMGAVAFSYDMVGYGDLKEFGHTFKDDELTSLGISLNGLQLWNSIRALDWLASLPDVDTSRLACTGESGGGTQTFELCAVDDRIAVAAPVCMVSDWFQGGCECENAPNLRVGTDNMEIAACFAPKPQILIGATGDWTSKLMEKVAPPIRDVYKLYGQEGNFAAVIHTAPHNYNRKSRESVYTFLRQTLWGEKVTDTVVEAPFTPEKEATLSVWDAEHHRPEKALDPERMKSFLRGQVESQVAAYKPTSSRQWREARATLRAGWNTLLGCSLPKPAAVTAQSGDTGTNEQFDYRIEHLSLARTGQPGRIPAVLLVRGPKPVKRLRELSVVIHPRGAAGLMNADGTPGLLLAGLLRKREPVLIPDVFLGGNADAARRQESTYYSTYNKTLTAERVQDILDSVAYARTRAEAVNLAGVERAGVWVLLARPFAGELRRTAAEAAWDWPAATAPSDEMWLPGEGRYGGVKAAAALCTGSEPLFLYNFGNGFDVTWAQAAQKYAPGDELKLSNKPVTPDALAAWLAEG